MSTSSPAARVLKFYLIAQQSPPLFPTALMILAWQPLKGLRRFNQRALQRGLMKAPVSMARQIWKHLAAKDQTSVNSAGRHNTG